MSDTREATQEAAKQGEQIIDDWCDRWRECDHVFELPDRTTEDLSKAVAAALLAAEARGERRGIERAIELLQKRGERLRETAATQSLEELQFNTVTALGYEMSAAALRSLLEPTTPTTEKKDAK